MADNLTNRSMNCTKSVLHVQKTASKTFFDNSRPSLKHIAGSSFRPGSGENRGELIFPLCRGRAERAIIIN